MDLASRLARLAPEDPELMPELGPQTYTAVEAFVEGTADLDAEARAEAIGRAIGAATAAGKPAGAIFAAGYLEANARAIAVATSNGLFAYHRTTDADFSVTARTPDGTGSGWAHGGARDWSAVDPVAIGRVAAQKAVASRNPQEIAPGLYTAVLEPQAVTDLIPLLAGALNARNADEGRSAFSKPGGGTASARRSPTNASRSTRIPPIAGLRGQPFDPEGLPLRRMVWIEKGILKNLAYSRFWAEKQGKQPTGSPLRRARAGGRNQEHRGVDRGLCARCARHALLLHQGPRPAHRASDRADA